MMGTACIALGLLLDGYVPPRATAQSQTGPGVGLKRIGVIPFFKGRCGRYRGEILDCPLSQHYFNPERVSRRSDLILTGHVHQALQEQHPERVISLEMATEAYERISKDEVKDTLRTLAIKLGEAVEVNLMVAGTLWRYEERGGGAVGAFSPASVAFAIYVIEVPSGRRLWKGKFDETQRALFDNVLDTWAFFKKGAKWLSADELARYGVKEVLRKFPF